MAATVTHRVHALLIMTASAFHSASVVAIGCVHGTATAPRISLHEITTATIIIVWCK